MASEDVIELVSSDEESEPAPIKGMANRQPNVMVHFPNKLPGITIKKTKPNGGNNKFSPSKPFGFQQVIKQSNRGPKNMPLKPVRIHPISLQNPIPLNRGKIQQNINPLASNIPIFGKQFVNSAKVPSSPNCLSRLPKSVVIKKSSSRNNQQNQKRSFAHPQTSGSLTIKKQKLNSNFSVKNISGMTSNKPTPAVAVSNGEGGQHWYLKPEVAGSSQENDNNREPNLSQMIEIVIEDSPVKPTSNKHSITITDSPVQTEIEKRYGSSGSDNEDRQTVRSPKSKKRLGYPTKSNGNKTIEIELEPIVIAESQTNENIDDHVIEVAESPQKRSVENEGTSNDSNSEFHSIYQDFIDLCFKLENSEDMKKIVEKKIKTYYRQTPKEYTESEEFLEMISCKMMSMKGSPDKMFLYIKDVVDELKMQRDMAKTQREKKEEEEAASATAFYGEEIDKDKKKKRQVHKLEKTLKKLHRAIQKLEEQEVDFDDDGDSVYILTDRYKERLIRVHAKLCELTKTKMPSEPKVHLEPRPGRPAGPAKRLEKWINRQMPNGKPLPFPDFHDALRCVREANEEDNLHWNEVDIMEEARDLFTRCGIKLQRRRQEKEWRIAASRLPTDEDPAKDNEELRLKLENNKKLAASRECEVINKFAEKQNQLKLEGEEIGDKEAEESPEESADEATDAAKDEESALENTDDRKERLIRLIKEKSKKEKESKLERDQVTNGMCDNKDINASDDVATTDSVVMETEVIKPKDESKEIKEEKMKEVEENTKVDRRNLEEATVQDESVSISSEDVQSDVDELHLLRRLHSRSEAQTSSSESDIESAIAISDSFSDSESERKEEKKHKAMNDDVVSIENSSDSEHEMLDDGNNSELDSELEQIIEGSEDEAPKTNDSIVIAEANEKQNEIPKTIEINEDILLSEGDSQDSSKIANNETNGLDANLTNEKAKPNEKGDEINKEMEISLLYSDTDSQDVSNKNVAENNKAHDNEKCVSDSKDSTQKNYAEKDVEMNVAISKDTENEKPSLVSENEETTMVSESEKSIVASENKPSVVSDVEMKSVGSEIDKPSVVSGKVNSDQTSHLEEIEMEIQQLCEPDGK